MADERTAKERPNRKTMRLKGYDYSRGGCYFVTICVRERKAILSKIFPQKQENLPNRVGTGVPARPQYVVALSPYGKIVEETVLYINKQYDAVCIDKYCIMPDHIHLLVTLQSADLICQERQGCLSLRDVVRQFKTYTTKRCREVAGDKKLLLWQPHFYDHIIRNDEDYCEKWQYIEENPVKYLYAY